MEWTTMLQPLTRLDWLFWDFNAVNDPELVIQFPTSLRCLDLFPYAQLLNTKAFSTLTSRNQPMSATVSRVNSALLSLDAKAAFLVHSLCTSICATHIMLKVHLQVGIVWYSA